MANGYFDLGTWYCITPFVGGGVGIAAHKFAGLTDSGGGVATDATPTNFAWAVMAGLALNVTPNLKIELGYRYLDMGNYQQQSDPMPAASGMLAGDASLQPRLPGRPARLPLRLRRRAGPHGSARDQILSLRQQRRISGARPKARAVFFGFRDFRAGPLSPRLEKSGIAGVMPPRRTPIADQEPLPPGGNAPELSVSELANALKRTVEDRFGLVRVRGEVSNYRGPHSSGHVYFSLEGRDARGSTR